MHYGVEKRFVTILDVPSERIQSVGESVVDGPIVGRPHTHRVQVVVGTEEIGYHRKRVHERIYGKLHDLIEHGVEIKCRENDAQYRPILIISEFLFARYHVFAFVDTLVLYFRIFRVLANAIHKYRNPRFFFRISNS